MRCRSFSCWTLVVLVVVVVLSGSARGFSRTAFVFPSCSRRQAVVGSNTSNHNGNCSLLLAKSNTPSPENSDSNDDENNNNNKQFWDEKFKADNFDWRALSNRIMNAAGRNAAAAFDRQLDKLEALAAAAAASNTQQRPTIVGDYDWDEAYRDDPDWITGDAVPGKMKMTTEQMEAQERALDELTTKWMSTGYEMSSDDAPPETINEDT